MGRCESATCIEWEDYLIALHRTEQELIRHNKLLPVLPSLREHKGWASERRKPQGFIRTYRLAFAAVDLIITDKGLSRAVDYFRSGNFSAPRYLFLRP
jgi:hypothetical protein